ncbi:hypothetical protein [Pseudomonas aeruginosa]|uniref:hypothetical protein n=1 Tax=Pseudomonas aeruginosa TaxID=287 RepID=UPI0033960613
MTKANECTCPSGDGSLRHPCPAHPALVEQAGGDERAAFRPAQVISYRPGVGEVTIYVAGRVPGYMNIGDTVYVSDRAPVEQPIAALAQPSPVRSSLLINGYQLRAALDFIAPDGTAEQLESEACIEWRQQDADFLEAGLYAFCAEYPEEGGVLLDEEPTTAQPSPLQSEQAEAERPEVVGYLATAEHPKHGQPHKAFNYFKDQHDAQVAHWRERGCEVSDDELMTVAQHGRIVGALRARNEKLEADAGALEWLRSTFKVHKAIVEQAGCGTIEQLAEQRDAANSRLHEVSVACATAEQERDAALARIAELEAALSSALSQHGVKFMDPPDGGDTPLIEQVCRMSQALSELEKQEPVGEVRESGGTLTAVIVRHSYATKLPVGTKLYAAPVSQAQRSVPETINEEANSFLRIADAGQFKDNAVAVRTAAVIIRGLLHRPPLMQSIIRHRIGLTPEYEGQWHADLYGEDGEVQHHAEADTPDEAVRAVVALAAAPGNEGV